MGWFWRSKCNKNCKRKFCSVRTVSKRNASLHDTHYRCYKLFIVKANVAHGIKADRLSSVRWKDILDVHCTDRVTVAAYRCIEDNFTANCKRCLISPSLFEAWAVGVPSLHRLHLQCNCSILSLPLYTFVVTVLMLPSLC